jgi:hypothetical protein
MKLSVRTVIGCALALVTFFAFASTASAAKFCVGAGTDCDQTFDFTEAGADAAYDAYNASDSEDDVIAIAPGTIEFATSFDPEEGGVQGSLHIAGAGSGKTKLVFNEVADMNFHVDFGVDSKVSGLMIEAAGEMPDGRTGVALHGGTAEDVYVLMAPGGNRAFTFSSGTVCENCRAKVSGPSIAFHVDSGFAVIADGKAEVYDPDASVHARGISMESSSSQAAVSRTKLIKFNRGIFGYLGTLSIKDSLIDLGDQDGALGLEVDAQGNVDDDPSSVLDGVTIVGSGANQRGITITANATGTGSVSSTFANSLSHLTGADAVDVYCSHAGSIPLDLDVDYSMAEVVSANGTCSPTVTNATTGTPLFLDADAGDYRPAPGSPVIDAGNPSSGDAGRKDLWGGLRYVNGSDFSFAGDIDLGAGEYQNYAPNKPEVTAAPTTVFVGSPVTFNATGSDPNGQPVTFTWEFDEGGSAPGATVSRTYAAPGTYKAKAIASDGSLTRASVWLEVTVVAAPVVPLPTLVLGKPAGKFSIKLMKSAAKVATTKPKKGGSVKLTASAAIDAKVTLLRVKKGYSVGGSCKARQGKTGKAKRCDLAVGKARSFKVPGGTSYFTLGKKWGSFKIKPGAYKLKVDGLMGPRISTNLSVGK